MTTGRVTILACSSSIRSRGMKQRLFSPVGRACLCAMLKAVRVICLVSRCNRKGIGHVHVGQLTVSICHGKTFLEELHVHCDVDGSDITYTNWDSGEPSEQLTHQTYSEDGVIIRVGHSKRQKAWNDSEVYVPKRFVCSLSI